MFRKLKDLTLAAGMVYFGANAPKAALAQATHPNNCSSTLAPVKRAEGWGQAAGDAAAAGSMIFTGPGATLFLTGLGFLGGTARALSRRRLAPVFSGTAAGAGAGALIGFIVLPMAIDMRAQNTTQKVFVGEHVASCMEQGFNPTKGSTEVDRNGSLKPDAKPNGVLPTVLDAPSGSSQGNQAPPPPGGSQSPYAIEPIGENRGAPSSFQAGSGWVGSIAAQVRAAGRAGGFTPENDEAALAVMGAASKALLGDK